MTVDQKMANISVIIPVYQAERFIEKAVYSALEQPEVLEIILIEDGSKDNSLYLCKVLERAHYPKVRLIQHPNGVNCGAGASRNLGIRSSKGKYIAFLDADDFYLPGRFINDIEILQSATFLDGVYNALGVHFYDQEECERINFNLTTVKYFVPPESLFEEMSPIGNAGYFSGDGLTVRKEIFNKVGYFDSTLELSQDTHMWIKMAAKANLAASIIDRPVAMRGVHSANRTKDKVKFEYFRPLLFLSLLNWANCNDICVNRKRIIWNCLYNYYGKSIDIQDISISKKKFKMLVFLLINGVRNPYLLTYKKYISSFSILLCLPPTVKP